MNQCPRDSQDPHYLVPHYQFRPKHRRNVALIVMGYQVVGVQGVPRIMCSPRALFDITFLDPRSTRLFAGSEDALLRVMKVCDSLVTSARAREETTLLSKAGAYVIQLLIPFCTSTDVATAPACFCV